MFKKKGFIASLITFIIVMALLVATLPHFDWDLFKLGFWLWDKLWEVINRLAQWIGDMVTFKNLFK